VGGGLCLVCAPFVLQGLAPAGVSPLTKDGTFDTADELQYSKGLMDRYNDT